MESAARYQVDQRVSICLLFVWLIAPLFRSIENNIHTTCSDIVANCVVVGNGRPYPALFVEPQSPAAAASAHLALNLKREIIQRTSDFHSLLYRPFAILSLGSTLIALTNRQRHERIQDVRMIKVVPANSLPRTAAKGNIRCVLLCRTLVVPIYS